MSREDPQLRIRLPSHLKEKVEESAKANKRSITAEIIFRLNLTYLLDEDKSMFKAVAEPDSYVAHAERMLKEKIEEELPRFLALASRNIMTDEFKEELRKMSREEAQRIRDAVINKKPTE